MIFEIRFKTPDGTTIEINTNDRKLALLMLVTWAARSSFALWGLLQLI